MHRHLFNLCAHDRFVHTIYTFFRSCTHNVNLREKKFWDLLGKWDHLGPGLVYTPQLFIKTNLGHACLTITKRNMTINSNGSSFSILKGSSAMSFITNILLAISRKQATRCVHNKLVSRNRVDSLISVSRQGTFLFRDRFALLNLWTALFLMC